MKPVKIIFHFYFSKYLSKVLGLLNPIEIIEFLIQILNQPKQKKLGLMKNIIPSDRTKALVYSFYCRW